MKIMRTLWLYTWVVPITCNKPIVVVVVYSTYFLSQKWSHRSYKLQRYWWFYKKSIWKLVKLAVLDIIRSWNYISAPCAEQSLHGSLPCADQSLHCFHPCAEQICRFCSAMDGSNADFALHMEGSHADFAPHKERRHSFRYQKELKFQFLPKF